MIPIRSLNDLMEAGSGYQRAMVLFVALKIGVFRALASGPADARAIARRVGADPRRLAILLNALVAMGLLRKEGGRYANGRIAAAHLLDGPGSKASLLLHHLDCWSDWSSLEERIRSGRKGTMREGDVHDTFIRGMEDNARERAAAVAGRIPLRPGQRLLDLGGGPGTYAAAWARKYPGASVTLFDIPETLRVTRSILREKGVSRRVRLMGGDFLTDPIGGPYDLIWISQILHAFSERECLLILTKARRALAGGGRALVQEFLLDGSGTGPPGPAFFSVHMVAVTPGGRAYTAGEIAAMLARAGFRSISADRPDARGVGIVSGTAASSGSGPRRLPRMPRKGT